MIRHLSIALVALGLSAGAAAAAGAEGHVNDYDFSFEGPFGTYDQMQLQRGLQVYTEICSACHGMKYVPILTLGDPGGQPLFHLYLAFVKLLDRPLLVTCRNGPTAQSAARRLVKLGAGNVAVLRGGGVTRGALP